MSSVYEGQQSDLDLSKSEPELGAGLVTPSPKHLRLSESQVHNFRDDSDDNLFSPISRGKSLTPILSHTPKPSKTLGKRKHVRKALGSVTSREREGSSITPNRKSSTGLHVSGDRLLDDHSPQTRRSSGGTQNTPQVPQTDVVQFCKN